MKKCRTKKSFNVREKRMLDSGITLIALVITIIILLILAGITINLALGDDGIINKAQKVADEYKQAEKDELDGLNELLNLVDDVDSNKGVETANPPKILTGMTKIMFTEPTDNKKGEVIKEGEKGFEANNWYNYKEKRWANVETKDESMWVWIPRFAYKIIEDATYNESNIATGGGKIDIKFLIGTSDNYYDENGELKTAKRASDLKDGEIADTSKDYYVHPAFTDESKLANQYENGGWDEELTGIWVAKFEAGYAGGNIEDTSKQATPTSLTYSQETVWGGAVETVGGTADGNVTARNWLDGEYSTTSTKIKYPVFTGTTYSMNYINHNDAFLLGKELVKANNPYGLSSSETDSHLMKDSEWGAVAYLSQSKYGLDGENIAINNISLNSNGKQRTNSTGKTGVESVYAVTGLTDGTTDTGPITVKKEKGEEAVTKINSTTANAPAQVTKTDDSTANVYTWEQKTGTKASSTGTIYGIYDLSGGLWERTAGYTANGNGTLTTFGSSLVTNGEKSTKYTMVYPHDAEDKNETNKSLDDLSKLNYAKNTRIFGNAMRETSRDGIGTTSWYGDCSGFVALGTPFSVRGGSWCDGRVAGLFYFTRSGGYGSFCVGLRAVLVASPADT